jgi:hypothetical protein
VVKHYALFAAALKCTIINASSIGDVDDVKKVSLHPATGRGENLLGWRGYSVRDK